MLFRRRERPSVRERLRVFLLPRRNYARSFKYYGRRIMRLSASPHSVAAGAAAGGIASCTPFIGLHFLLGFAIAYILRGNMLAAALGTAIGNPLTFPLIWLITYEIGWVVLGFWDDGPMGRVPLDIAGIMSSGWDSVATVIGPMIIGAIPLGVVVGFAVYFVTRWGVASYQNGRSERLAARRGSAEASGDAE
ncbi:MAG: DUF2062 domain-containing protein [Bauldia sp.]|nr:DUF2062 domain-containing protein [Bauldia sp.]